MAKNVEHENCKFLVSFFCGKIESSFWAREIKIAKKLLKEHPEKELWEKLVIKTKLPSLAFFLTENGQEMVRKHFAQKNLDLPTKKEYDLTQESSIQPTQSINKPKSVFDFLKK